MKHDLFEPRLKRRRLVKLITLGLASSVVGGRLWQSGLLADVRGAGAAGATFQIHVSDYPALQGEIGSVRLGINPVRPDAQPFPDGDFYPILVTRDPDGHFHVLDTECRHASCVVPATDTFTIVCPCHGSAYLIDGTVIGGPATQSLKTYAFEFDGADTLTIHVPAWAFSASVSLLSGGSASRVKLDFVASPQVVYEILFREHIETPWAVIPFATSATGPTNQASLTGLGLSETVYVDRLSASGFYAVNMQLNEV